MKSHRDKPNVKLYEETITAKVREMEKTRDKISGEISTCYDPGKFRRLNRIQHSLNAKIQLLSGHWSDPSSTIMECNFSAPQTSKSF